MDIPKHLRRSVQRNSLTLYKAALNKCRKNEVDAGVPTAGTDKLLAVVEILLEENVDQAAVARDSMLEGTPMGDQMTREHFKDADGTDLTADALDDWMRRAAHCHVPYGVIAKWPLSERQLIAAWLRAVDANTTETIHADTTLTPDMALDVAHAVSIAPSSISPEWFRQPLPLDALTDQGITTALHEIGAQVPPDVLSFWDNDVRRDVYYYTVDVRAKRPAARPAAVQLEWFRDDLQAAIEAGTQLAMEERQDGDALPQSDSAPAESLDDDEELDQSVVDGWLITGPWNVRPVADDDNPGTSVPGEYEVFFTGVVKDTEQVPLHPFVYNEAQARQVAAKINRNAKRAAAGGTPEEPEEHFPASLDDDDGPAAAADDVAGTEAEPTDDISTKRRSRKKKTE